MSAVFGCSFTEPVVHFQNFRPNWCWSTASLFLAYTKHKIVTQMMHSHQKCNKKKWWNSVCWNLYMNLNIGQRFIAILDHSYASSSILLMDFNQFRLLKRGKVIFFSILFLEEKRVSFHNEHLRKSSRRLCASSLLFQCARFEFIQILDYLRR